MLLLRQRTVGQQQNRYMKVFPGRGQDEQLAYYHRLIKTWSEVQPEDAREEWTREYIHAEKHCGHVHGKKDCKGELCEFNKRIVNHFILTGLVLPFWRVVRHKVCTEWVKVSGVTCENPPDRIVGIEVKNTEKEPNLIEQIAEAIRNGVPDPKYMHNMPDRIPSDPLFRVMLSSFCPSPCRSVPLFPFTLRRAARPDLLDGLLINHASAWYRHQHAGLKPNVHPICVKISFSRRSTMCTRQGCV